MLTVAGGILIAVLVLVLLPFTFRLALASFPFLAVVLLIVIIAASARDSGKAQTPMPPTRQSEVELSAPIDAQDSAAKNIGGMIGFGGLIVAICLFGWRDKWLWPANRDKTRYRG